MPACTLPNVAHLQQAADVVQDSLQPFSGTSTCCATQFKVSKPQLASKAPCDAQLHAVQRSTISERKRSNQAGLACFSQHLSALTTHLHVGMPQLTPSHCSPASSPQAQVQVHCSSLLAGQPVSAWQVASRWSAPPAG